jgi:prepilin-type N-terminal cleavage/methylation domain-containing protein
VKRRATSGFSLIEILVAVAIASVLAAFAIPMTINVVKGVRLTAAVSSATGAIQSTRYLAIMHGYSYEITFTPASNSYQVLNQVPPATTFSNVGTVVPISGPGAVTISRTITLQFSANGTVTEIPTTGNMTFSITNAIGGSNTITVSSVGNVSVTTP